MDPGKVDALEPQPGLLGLSEPWSDTANTSEFRNTNMRRKQSGWSQQTLRAMKKPKMQNTEALNVETSLETQLRELEDTKAKQSQEIQDLKSRISSLEKHTCLIEEKLTKLENEFNKEKRSSSTQTENEQKVETADIRRLIQAVNPLPISGDALTSTQTLEPSGKVLIAMDPTKPCIQSAWSSEEGPRSRTSNASASNEAPFTHVKLGSAPSFTHRSPTAKRTHHEDMSPPKNPKQPRLDGSSPDPARRTPPPDCKPRSSMTVALPRSSAPSSDNQEGESRDQAKATQHVISTAFEVLQDSCYDVFPTIRTHALQGRTSQVNVLTEEEQSIISYYCVNQSLVETFLSKTLCKIKERGDMKHKLLQSLCRVYVGLCRETGHIHKARALAYRLLKEDFPEAPELLLYMVATWPSLLSHDSPLCSAIHIASKLKAKGEVFDYLSNYLHWDKRPPGDIHRTISSLLKALVKDSSLSFEQSRWYGVDLCPAAWEYVFGLDLLCAQLDWTWIYRNIIQMKLWQIMNSWLRQLRHQQAQALDVCVATIMRLLGRLGQVGLKKNLSALVEDVAKSIHRFGRDGLSEGMPREVQLSMIYATHDLAPSNPKEALKVLTSWQRKITQPVPSAVTNCIAQITPLCH